MDGHNDNTLEAWKNVFLKRGAEAVSGLLEGKLGKLPPDVLRAVLRVVPSREIPRRGFAGVDATAPLAGVPFFAKDLFATAGDAIGAGSTFLAALRGIDAEDASLVATARAAGAVLCGKTHLNEFALGTSGENPHFGNCPHPRFPKCVSGGSSSGSAFVVAAGIAPFALGTDTAGSIRIPAAFCGICGLRLQPALPVNAGTFPLSPSFDTVGVLAANAHDLGVLAQLLFGMEMQPLPPRRLWLDCRDGVSPEVLAATSCFARELGFAPDADAARFFAEAARDVERHYPVLGANEAAQVHCEWLDAHRADYDPVVWARLDAGRHRGPDELARARKCRNAIGDCFRELFKTWPLIAMPVTPTGARPASAHTEAFRAALLRLNAPASMASLPAVALPVPLPGGLTTGIQLIFPSLERVSIPPMPA
jgi:amidase/aspartyl-tRNA(Asn)/glutamyl-tRNA(Gln) amidotransferase subunit A